MFVCLYVQFLWWLMRRKFTIMLCVSFYVLCMNAFKIWWIFFNVRLTKLIHEFKLENNLSIWVTIKRINKIAKTCVEQSCVEFTFGILVKWRLNLGRTYIGSKFCRNLLELEVEIVRKEVFFYIKWYKRRYALWRRNSEHATSKVWEI